MILNIPDLKIPEIQLSRRSNQRARSRTKITRIEPFAGMQTKALESPAEEILLGGEAGGGKSWLILFSALEDIQKYPSIRILILRRTAPNLGRLIEMALDMYLPLGFKFSSQDREYKKPCFTYKNGAKIIFGHMQHEKDKHNYQGMEFQRLHFDEVTHFTESQYLYVFSRVRSSSKDGTFIPPRVMNSANPDGEGVEWVKRRWIDKLEAHEIGAFRRDGTRDLKVPLRTKNSLTRQWIPSIRSENKAQDNEAYEKMLSQMTAEQQKALKYGVWDSLDRKGQLIRGTWLDRAFSGEVKKMGIGSAIGSDPAEQGQDRAVIVCGRGNSVKEIYFEMKTTQPRFAKSIKDYMIKYGMNQTRVGIDTAGLGSGVYWDLIEITNSDVHANIYKAVYSNPLYDSKFDGALKTKTMRAQMYWQLMKDFEKGNIDLSPLLGTEENEYNDSFDEIELLKQELLFLTYTTDKGHFQVIEKDALRKDDSLGRSPDFADALAIWNWIRNEELAIHKNDIITEKGEGYGDPWEEMENESEIEESNAGLWV